MQLTLKKWTVEILNDPVFLLHVTKTSIHNNMEHKPCPAPLYFFQQKCRNKLFSQKHYKNRQPLMDDNYSVKK